MDGKEFIRRVRKLGKKNGVEVVVTEQGSGSHKTLFLRQEIYAREIQRNRRRAFERHVQTDWNWKEGFIVMLTLCYKYAIKGKPGDYVVHFPDVPEALTGAGTKQECHDLARDCLLGALAGYIHINETIPLPSGALAGDGEVYLRPVEAAKVALWNAMQEKNMTRVKLASLLDMDDRAVRRWLDLDHASRIEDINRALRVIFHKRLVTSVMEAEYSGTDALNDTDGSHAHVS